MDITPRRLQTRQEQGNITAPVLWSPPATRSACPIRRHMDARSWVAAETGQIAVHLAEGSANMLGWFQALMPREERFFQLFEKHATSSSPVPKRCAACYVVATTSRLVARKYSFARPKPMKSPGRCLSRSAAHLSRHSIALTFRT